METKTTSDTHKKAITKIISPGFGSIKPLYEHLRLLGIRMDKYGDPLDPHEPFFGFPSKYSDTIQINMLNYPLLEQIDK